MDCKELQAKIFNDIKLLEEKVSSLEKTVAAQAKSIKELEKK